MDQAISRKRESICTLYLTTRKTIEDEEEQKEMEEKLLRLKQVRRQYLTARNTRIRIGKEYQAEIPDLPTNKQL